MSKNTTSVMKKLLSCREIGCECDYIVTGETEEQILRHNAKHSIEKHGFIKIGDKIKGFIYTLCN